MQLTQSSTKKGATYYSIAVALARITKAILDDENAVLPLSVFQKDNTGVENVFIGQPAIVGVASFAQLTHHWTMLKLKMQSFSKIAKLLMKRKTLNSSGFKKLI